ncbi:hypothetical protein SAMD00019534_029560 [Acytostelium subglobosum LB1]|uniref:hypothetical protein n=1 Tax=Acytostelium subglobosum LB1 TaxID=1410327 RepID=UPI000645193B|nr:hypothetical protein SAMD00019534_029560 [Acytostelium subglobosum LB1]GAM19781.1 hypothetical protein SAMD00019534_029560 [Acytostelium subglobosum LB1]|eukprot:XP_012756543.1 hypothetical protein SAMD00019534_029560 [Acytostelium subglobosum LB1]
MDKSCKDVTEQFKELHEYLMVEEHKIMQQLIKRMEEMETVTSEIVKDVIDVNIILNKVAPESRDDGKEIGTIIESIATSSSMDEFVYTLPQCTQQQGNADGMSILSMIQRVQQSMTNEHEVIKPLKVNIKTAQIDDIKKQIQTSFVIIDQETYGPGIIITHSGITISMLALKDNKWTSIKEKWSDRKCAFSSSVYARGHVYVFGGTEAPSIKGGAYISTCYDGGKYIYLIGGTDDTNRVDCLNIETQAFSNVGKLPVEMTSYPASVYHDHIIYVLDATNLYMFNVISKNYIKITNEHLKKGPNYSICFDGVDTLYILNSKVFFSWSISTKLSYQLSSPTTVYEYARIVYNPSNHNIIVLGGKNKNFSYSIKDNNWSPLNDDDPVVDRYGYGAIYIPN